MSVDVIMGDADEDVDVQTTEEQGDPDEFFAKNAFRIVYQTNIFFFRRYEIL